MAIRQITTNSQINAYLDTEIERIESVIINVMIRVGMQCVTEARTMGSYTDRTGNLRSSIGFSVLKNGVPIKRAVFDGSNTTDGKSKGTEFIKSLESGLSKGIVLIVVAGMEYAAQVETSKNVLASSELLAEKLVPELLQKLGFIKK